VIKSGRGASHDRNHNSVLKKTETHEALAVKEISALDPGLCVPITRSGRAESGSDGERGRTIYLSSCCMIAACGMSVR
jgi:hypothetical protein